jgi:hypothetical protein
MEGSARRFKASHSTVAVATIADLAAWGRTIAAWEEEFSWRGLSCEMWSVFLGIQAEVLRTAVAAKKNIDFRIINIFIPMWIDRLRSFT